jgi:gliding motility-associated-like protein/uncharacterized repeat protein (TIGR01451 family)
LGKLNEGESDSITITLTARAYMGLTRIGGYVYSSPYGGIVRNDTSYAALRIVENLVDLRVAKRVTKNVLLEREMTLYDTVTVYTYKFGIQGITLVDSLPPSVNNAEIVDVKALKLKVDNFKVEQPSGNNNNRYVVTTKSPISLNANDTAVVIVKYTINKDGKYPSVARVFCDSVEVTKDNNVARDTTSVSPLVNLQAKLTAKAKYSMLEGDTVTYTLTVSHDKNSSNANVEGVALTFDPVPSSLIFLSATYWGKSYKPRGDGRLAIGEVSIPAGGSANVEVQVRVRPNAADRTPDNTISWRAYLSHESDAWHDNDTALVKVTPVDNGKDVSVSITPVDTVFYISANKNKNKYTNPFNDTIRVKNNGTEELSNITVLYSNPKYEQEGFLTEPTKVGVGNEWKWIVLSLPAGKDTALVVLGCKVPYDSAASYRRSVTVSAGVLEADPTNNQATATARVIHDLDFEIDSVQLLGRDGVPMLSGESYTQGDTVAVRVKLTNKKGSKEGTKVTVALADTAGFTPVGSFTHQLKGTLAQGGALYDTLKLVVDTFTDGGTLSLRIAASAVTTQGSSRRPFTVTDNARSEPFTVHKGADAYVWLTGVAHDRPYYKNLLYGIAVGNRGQYKATGVQLHHAAASDTVRLDSVRIYNPSGGVDTTLMPPPNGAKWDSVWNLGAIAPKEKDTAYVLLYVVVTKANLEAEKSMSVPVTGYTTCINDSSPKNDTIKNALSYERALKVTRNPYHLKVTKTSGQPPDNIDPLPEDQKPDTGGADKPAEPDIPLDNLANNAKAYSISAKAASQTPYSRITDAIAYTITVENVGDSAAYKLKIVDTIPTNTIKSWHGLSFVESWPDNAAFDTLKRANDTAYYVKWHVDTLKPSERKTLTFSALVHEAGAVVNTARLVFVQSDAKHLFDPDPENKKGHTSVDTTKVQSAQRVSVNYSAYPYSDGKNPVDTFTQGDTLTLVITVNKSLANANEKALGIKINFDTLNLNNRLKFFRNVEVEGDHTLNNTFKGTTWRLDLDTNREASGKLMLYAVVASNLLTQDEPLDLVELRISVRDTSEYYPKIQDDVSVKIYRKYRDLDLAVKVKAEEPKESYPNEPFSYTITIQNKGVNKLQPEDSITLIATLPLGISYNTKDPNNFTQTPDDVDTIYSYGDKNENLVVLRWNNLRSFLGGIKNGEGKSITLQNCSGSAGRYIICGACLKVNRREVNQPEADKSNNFSQDTVTIISPLKFRMKFELDPSSGKDTVTQGDTRTLRFTVFNDSDRPVTDLSLKTEGIPSQLSFIRCTNDQGEEEGNYNAKTKILSWDSPLVPPNDSVTGTFVVQATGTGEAKLVANLYYEYEKDPRQPVTDPDTVKLYVKRDPYDVSLTKTAYKAGTPSKPIFYEDETAPYAVDYKISVTAGSEYLAEVVVTDTLPAGVDTAQGFAAACPKAVVTPLADGRLAIVDTIEELLGDEPPVDIIFHCQVKSNNPNSYINRAYVTCADAGNEKNSDNNTDTALVEVRGLVNLKVDMALFEADSTTEYPRGYKFRQGDTVLLKVTVQNNGKETSTGNTPTSVNVTPSDGDLGSFGYAPLTYLGTDVKYFKIRTDKCGTFSISADAVTSYNKDGATKESHGNAKVANIIILPGADVKVSIEVDPPGYDYNIHRAYTIKLKNIGQYRADMVELMHKLDANIVSLDSVEVTTLNGFSLRLRKGLWQGKDLDSLVSKSPTHERLRYFHFDSTLTYTLYAVGVGEEASVKLFVTTVEPRGGAKELEILPYAKAYVYQELDRNLHNNEASGGRITVHPNPYNVSISIVWEKNDRDEVDLPNVAGADVDRTFTITAKNIGKRAAGGNVSYKVPSGLVIKEAGEGRGADLTKPDDSCVWTISSQLEAGDSLTFEVTVAPESASSKGQKLNIVHIKPVFGNSGGSKDADTLNNVDTARLNLFSVLDSWPLMEAFSPNGDGRNDWFVIHDLESSDIVDSAEIVILNRYGSEVYYHRNYEDAQKDESKAFTGAGLPEGSYFYQLTVKFTDGSVSKRGGIITLRRSRWRLK